MRLKVTSQGRVVPDIPDPDFTVVGSTSVQKTVRMHGDGRVLEASLERRDGRVRLDDRRGLDIAQRPRRVCRSNSDVSFRRVNGEPDNIPLVTRHVSSQSPLGRIFIGSPHLDRLISRRRQDRSRRSTDEFNLGHRLGVSLQSRQRLFTLEIVDLNGLVRTSRQNMSAIRRQVDSGDTGRLGAVERGDGAGLCKSLDIGSLAVSRCRLSLFSAGRQAEGIVSSRISVRESSTCE